MLCGIHSKKSADAIHKSVDVETDPSRRWTPNPCTTLEYAATYGGAHGGGAGGVERRAPKIEQKMEALHARKRVRTR